MVITLSRLGYTKIQPLKDYSIEEVRENRVPK